LAPTSTPNPQYQPGASYQSEITDLKNWIASRIGWMDWAIQGNCFLLPSSQQEMLPEISVMVYPNPMKNSATFSIYLPREEKVTLKVYNLMGDEIGLLADERRPAGELRLVFSRQQLPAGVYFYQLQAGNLVRAGKIVME